MSLGKKIWNDFITGIAVLFPAFITIIILSFLISKVNGILLEPITRTFETLGPFLARPYLIFFSKILVFIVAISLVILLGMATKIFIIKKALHLTEGIFLNVPLVRKIYSASKEITVALLGQGKNMLKAVVLIEYPRKGLYSIGFITNESAYSEILKNTQEPNMVTVYVPSVPNPTTGFFVFLPKSEIKYLNISIEEAMKLVISAGIVEPGPRATKEELNSLKDTFEA